MIELVKLLWNLALAGFHENARIRKNAGFTFVCLAISVFFGVLTAWLSYPAYGAMVEQPDPLLIWGLAGAVAVLMFFSTTLLGNAVAEKIRNVPALNPPRVTFVALAITLAVGGYDAYKGFKVGSVERSREAHQVHTFEESNPGPKPYAEEIASLEKQIETLLADKVMWKGQMTTRWTSSQEATKLQAQLREMRGKQLAAIEEQRDVHAERIQYTQTLQAETIDTYQVIALILYALQFLLGIQIGLFGIELDMLDGSRDGEYDANKKQAKPSPTRAPAQAQQQSDKARADALQREIDQLYKQNGTQQPIQNAATPQHYQPIGYRSNGATVTARETAKTARTVTVGRSETATKHRNGYRITCQNCGTSAVKRSASAKFCSDKCRLEHHRAQKA